MPDVFPAHDPSDPDTAPPTPATTDQPSQPALHRHFGLWEATALNITMIVGAGVFVTIPLMLRHLHGPYAILGWLVAGLLVLLDGLVWGELGAAFPGSGGTYVYLLECYGRDRWGRLMAFLFIWQFMLTGPLELASGLIAVTDFVQPLTPGFATFEASWKWSWVITRFADKPVAVTVSPARGLALGLGALVVAMLYRHITTLGRFTVTFSIGVLATVVWILVVGGWWYDHGTAFDFAPPADVLPADFAARLGAVMVLALYSYIGYYNVCYIGDEVTDPARTLPRSVLLSVAAVCVLFVGLHLTMLGTVSWRAIPTGNDAGYSLAAEFVRQTQGTWAVSLVTLLLVWTCFGAVFAGLLGYARIPYGAAKHGHFFPVFAAVHPTHHIPHVALLTLGGLTLFWTLFDLESVIQALIIVRILPQFAAQIIGLLVLRRRPGAPRPFAMWGYPWPALLALAGWLYVFSTAGYEFILLSVGTLGLGGGAFLIRSWRAGQWPFAVSPANG